MVFRYWFVLWGALNCEPTWSLAPWGKPSHCIAASAELGVENVCAVVTTTSCFAPRCVLRFINIDDVMCERMERLGEA